jgi:hypothetical protein
MSFGVPEDCPERGGDVQLAEGFRKSLLYSCVECGHNFRRAQG